MPSGSQNFFFAVGSRAYSISALTDFVVCAQVKGNARQMSDKLIVFEK
jgi:hypothetical protein